MIVPSLDIALLGKELDWATSEWRKSQRGESSEWNQRVWFCGTKCCLAGKIALNDGWSEVPMSGTGEVSRVDVTGNVEIRRASYVANDLLGLSGFEHDLYNEDNNIWDLWRQAEQLTGGQLRAPHDVEEFDRNKCYNVVGGNSERYRPCHCGCGMRFPVGDY